jgi:DNA-binding MarR family transcriptional regulator
MNPATPGGIHRFFTQVRYTSPIKSLEQEIEMLITPELCATTLLEVVPLVMRNIRKEMRKNRGSDLSVPQFRSLAYISQNEGASLSDVADHIGLSLPSASKLVDGLVNRKLILRKPSEDDRRRIMLSLTQDGRSTLQVAVHATETYLAHVLSALSENDCGAVLGAMQILRPLFALAPPDVITTLRPFGTDSP